MYREKGHVARGIRNENRCDIKIRFGSNISLFRFAAEKTLLLFAYILFVYLILLCLNINYN